MSKTKNAKTPESCPAFKTMCGGQALIEGIMMRGPDKEAVVVRRPDGGLEVRVEPLKLVKTRHPWLGFPFLRGPVNFIDSMVHGVKALMYSAEFYPDEEPAPKKKKEKKKKGQEAPPAAPASEESASSESASPVEGAQPEISQPGPAPEEPKASEAASPTGGAEPETSQPGPAPEEPKASEAASPTGGAEQKGFSDAAMGAVVTVSVLLGLGLSILLFFILPTLITGLLTPFIANRLLLSLIEGVVRMAIFLAYIILISQMKDMKRVFRYHGAEHQTIYCYERGLELTVENVGRMPRHHPRCGTSFMFVIMFVAILVHALLGFGWDNVWLRLGVRLLSLPVIVSVTYEINRFVGRHDNWFTRILTAPGLWLQNWTTQAPDDSMMEVGIAALKEVLPEEKGADAW